MTNKPKVKSMGLRWQDHIVGDPVDTAMHLKYLHQKLNKKGGNMPFINFIGSFAILIALAIGGFLLANYVNTWEIANNYPYGKLCDVYNNCAK